MRIPTKTLNIISAKVKNITSTMDQDNDQEKEVESGSTREMMNRSDSLSPGDSQSGNNGIRREAQAAIESGASVSEQKPEDEIASDFYESTERDIDKRIVMLGKTGAGKSSVCNSVARFCGYQQKIFETHLVPDSITSKCQGFGCEVLGQTLYLVDTPGVFDTRQRVAETLLEIIKCLALTSPGPHCFLLAIRIDAKFTEEEAKTITNIRAVFGSGIDDYTVIVFTHKDQLVREEKSFKEYLQYASPQFKKVVDDCGKRYVLVDNFAKGAELREQIEKLVTEVSKVIERNKGNYFVNKAIQMSEEILRREILSQADGFSSNVNKELLMADMINRQREQIEKEEGLTWEAILKLLLRYLKRMLGISG